MTIVAIAATVTTIIMATVSFDDGNNDEHDKQISPCSSAYKILSPAYLFPWKQKVCKPQQTWLKNRKLSLIIRKKSKAKAFLIF